MIKKELAGYSRVPGSSDQKTDSGRFGLHPRYNLYRISDDPEFKTGQRNNLRNKSSSFVLLLRLYSIRNYFLVELFFVDFVFVTDERFVCP